MAGGNGEPSWWRACTVQNVLGGRSPWYTLIECFPVNSLRYAKVRLTLSSCDGSDAFERALSAEEYAALYGSTAIERMISAANRNELRIVIHDGTPSLAFDETRIELGEVRLPAADFVRRVIVYDANTRANVERMRKREETLAKEAAALEKKVREEGEELKKFEEKVTYATSILMQEKLAHFQKDFTKKDN